ncbi:MAG: FkbM family methyltransferase [Pseudomonadota bacterium]
MNIFERLYGKLIRVLPRPVVDIIRKTISFGRHVRYGWRGVTVKVKGAQYLIQHNNGREFRRARQFARHEPIFIDAFCTSVKKSSVVYDVGSAIGTYALLAAKTAPNATIIAFEPERLNFSALKSNIEANNADNIVALNIALGDENTEMHLDRRELGDIAGVGTHRLVNGTTSDAELDKIEVCRGDDLVAQETIPPPQLLKIDVEGFELRVVYGLEKTLRTHKPDILMEIHPELLKQRGDTREALECYLEALGYSCEQIRSPGETDSGHRQYHALFQARQSAERPL